jgi:hypothetical protein
LKTRDKENKANGEEEWLKRDSIRKKKRVGINMSEVSVSDEIVMTQTGRRT